MENLESKTQNPKSKIGPAPSPPSLAPLLVVAAVAFDSIRTPHGKAENVLGGAATYFSVSASRFA